MPELHRWDHELKCKGYFGFGGGYALAKGDKYEDGALYCNVCPVSQTCWESHQDRARKLFPEMMKKLDELAEQGLEGNELMEVWHEFTETAPPDIMLNGGNIEDGMRVGHGQPPKDRGPYTLTWPLEKRS